MRRRIEDDDEDDDENDSKLSLRFEMAKIGIPASWQTPNL
jgi:hypothetical protein